MVIASVGWYTADLKLEAARQEIKTVQQGRRADAEAYKAAAAHAEAKNLQEVRKRELENARKAQEADVVYDDLLRKYNANLLFYAQQQANKRPSGTVRFSTESTTTVGSDSTSESAEIYISFEDAGICAENTARIQAVKQWVDNLKTE